MDYRVILITRFVIRQITRFFIVMPMSIGIISCRKPKIDLKVPKYKAPKLIQNLCQT